MGKQEGPNERKGFLLSIYALIFVEIAEDYRTYFIGLRSKTLKSGKFSLKITLIIYSILTYNGIHLNDAGNLILVATVWRSVLIVFLDKSLSKNPQKAIQSCDSSCKKRMRDQTKQHKKLFYENLNATFLSH